LRIPDWEGRSGATFEAEKTAIIHFSRKAARVNSNPFLIKGERVYPQDKVKILGVTMDSQLRYRQHIARVSSRALEAAIELKRLKGLPRATARQLFTAMVAPILDYASNVWRYACGDRLMHIVNRVQKVGAQAIVSAFNKVATAVAEAEAHILPARSRFAKRAIKLWVDIHTLPSSNPLRTAGFRMFTRFISPMQQLAEDMSEVPISRLETIDAYAAEPWNERVEVITDESERAIELASGQRAIRIATSSSAKNDLVGFGVAIRLPDFGWAKTKFMLYSVTLGTREEQNPYTAELAAIVRGLRKVPQHVRQCVLIVFTSNKGAALSLKHPWHQSGQKEIANFYACVSQLRKRSNKVVIAWRPQEHDENNGDEDVDNGASDTNRNGNFALARLAKEAARKATLPGSLPRTPPFRAKSTTLNNARKIQSRIPVLPDNVGAFSKRIDIALPGRHTRLLYDALSWKEASILVQLRTGMARLNHYLAQIGAITSPDCACGYGRETVEHFVMRCTKWTAHRKELLQYTEDRRGSISFYLGGKTYSDDNKWTPDLKAVRATIGFAIATGRLQQTVKEVGS
jgi:ribonuclease HI